MSREPVDIASSAATYRHCGEGDEKVSSAALPPPRTPSIRSRHWPARSPSRPPNWKTYSSFHSAEGGVPGGGEDAEIAGREINEARHARRRRERGSKGFCPKNGADRRPRSSRCRCWSCSIAWRRSVNIVLWPIASQVKLAVIVAPPALRKRPRISARTARPASTPELAGRVSFLNRGVSTDQANGNN